MSLVRNLVGAVEMISMQMFVSKIRSFARSPELLFAECCETPLHKGSTAVTVWSTWEISRAVLCYLENSQLAAVIYPDGSAQLLSRDEDACLLFATLWELER